MARASASQNYPASQKNATSSHLHQSLTKLAKLSHQATQIPPKRSQERSPTNQTLTICFTNLPHNLLQTWPVLLHHLQKKTNREHQGQQHLSSKGRQSKISCLNPIFVLKTPKARKLVQLHIAQKYGHCIFPLTSSEKLDS